MTGREGQAGVHPQRVYKQVSVAERDGTYAILLDGKPIRTPRKAQLSVPTPVLAEAIAEEWRAQGERIDPETMRLTRLANSAIDLVRGREAEMIDELGAYAGSDLICYRAHTPRGLVERQVQQWDPVLDWANRELAADFATIVGITHVPQPQAALDAMRDTLKACDPFTLAALHNVVTLTGSALLALAMLHGRLTAYEVWSAAQVDEDWQISQWGEDAEATERRERRRSEFDAAARLLALVRRAPGL